MIPRNGALLLVDKSEGLSSFDVVRKLRREVGRDVKCGHAGTLDPLATGLLLVCLGKATKLISIFQQLPKRYLADVLFGTSTDSDDITGQVLVKKKVDQNTLVSSLEENLPAFKGVIWQRPPQFSALKVDGKRAYQLARVGKDPELKKRQVTVYDILVTSQHGDVVGLDINCSKGTYIRSIARDLGEVVGCGATIATLRRTAIGEFLAENALSDTAFSQESIAEYLIDADQALSFCDSFVVSEQEAVAVLNGRLPSGLPPLLENEFLCVRGEQGQLLAVLTVIDGKCKFVTVFN